jgi:hypothetical protein
MSADAFTMGNKVRDLVSGIEGIITGRTEWLNGCVQFIVTPPLDKDGKKQDMLWVDWQQLELVDSGITAHVQAQLAAAPKTAGGPSRAVPRAALPR